MDYDLIVIGSGPSGRAAAIQAGKLKRKVLVIDRKSILVVCPFIRVPSHQKPCAKQF